MSRTRWFRFGALSRPIALVDCPELLPPLLSVFRGWNIDPCPAPVAGDPLLTLRREGESYRLEADCISAPFRRAEAADAVCGFIAEFIRAFVEAERDLLCLHGAAVEFDGKLVVFPNRYRAGKSTLTVCLAAAGFRVFSDDVLPIGGNQDHALAPGILPRLRLPLPDDLEARTRDFLDRHQGLKSARYLYVDLPKNRLAPFGTEAPIGSFVLIERDPEAEPGIFPIGSGEVLRQVIWQNFARERNATDILRRLHRIVENANSFRLRYRCVEQAVELIAEAVAEGAFTCARSSQVPVGGPIQSAAALPSVPAVPGYQRNPQISEVTVDGERFLADSKSGSIHNLNPLASAIWRLLEQPVTREVMVAIVRVGYPEVPQEMIETDISAILERFEAKDLITRAGAEALATHHRGSETSDGLKPGR